MANLIRLELFKMSRRPRSYLGFAALGAMVAAMLTGLKYGPPPVEHLTASVSESFTLVGSFVNAGFVCWLLLRTVMSAFVPLLVCLAAGDMVSGEASEGTLRTLLARPVGRAPVLLAKYAAAVVYTFGLVGFLGAAGYLFGALVFGRGSLLVVEQEMAVFPEAEGLARMAAAYALAGVGMVTIATIAFFISTVVNNSTGAIIGAMAITFVSAAIGGIEYFKPIWPYLFTSHLDLWRLALEAQTRWGEMWRSIGYLSAYAGVFLAAALLVFRRKDVLT